MKKAETYGVIEKGTVRYIRTKEFLNIVYNTFKEGDRFRVTFERLYKKRSNEQNKYYWGCVLPILLTEIKEQGNDYDDDSLHEELKSRFGHKKEVHNKDGEIIELIRSTSTYTTSEFMEYLTEIKQWASEFWGCYIPDPNEQTKINI